MTKLEQFAALLEKEQGEGLLRQFPDWKLSMPEVQIKPGKKYTKVDVSSCGQFSGKYMVENDTGRIYGIKAYGVIHRGHYYGTLDTIHELDWSGYVGTMRLSKQASS